MPAMPSARIFSSLVAVAVAWRSSPELSLAKDIVFPACPAAIFEFCPKDALAGGGMACVASVKGHITSAEEVQCVVKENNKNGKYRCPPNLAVMCDPFQDGVPAATPVATSVPLLPPAQNLLFTEFPGDLELPLYCGLAQMGLNSMAYQPLTKDFSVNISVPFFTGDYTVAFDSFELGAVAVKKCDTRVALREDVLSVEASQLDVEILSLGWKVRRNSWPHFPAGGTFGQGAMTTSFNVSLDLAKEEEASLELELDAIDIAMGAQKHKWFFGALNKLVEFARPVVSEILQHEARVAVSQALQIVRTQGGCALLQDGLRTLAPVELQFTSKEPSIEHVPLIGNVLTSVNSTSIDLPTSMSCLRAEFNGTAITFHIRDFSFGAAFNWAYRKEGSHFWHNNGTGSVRAKVALSIHLDLERPEATDAQVGLPELDLQLHAEYDAWFYGMLPKVVGPLVRAAVNHLGSYLAKHEIKNVLKEKFSPLQNS